MKHILSVVVVLLASGCVAINSENVSGWSFIDGGSSTKRYAYSVVKKADGHPVRSGETSMRFEVRSGDCGMIYDWNDCKEQRERKELRQSNNYNVGENWYHWSIYLPKDYPDSWQARTTLGQFHNKNHNNKTHMIPAFMFRINGKANLKTREYFEFYTLEDHIHGSTGSGDPDLISIDEMRGNWTDILVHVKWSTKKDGFFRVYVNGNPKPTYSRSGSTKRKTYPVIFFKIGIYNSWVSGEMPTRIVYYDDVRKGTSCSEVTEYFDCDRISGRS